MWVLDVKCPHYLDKTSVKLHAEDSPHAERLRQVATQKTHWRMESDYFNLCASFIHDGYCTLCEMKLVRFEDPAHYRTYFHITHVFLVTRSLLM